MAGTAWHLVYGGFWGTVYFLLRSSLPLPQVHFQGPLYGLGLWALGPGSSCPR